MINPGSVDTTSLSSTDYRDRLNVPSIKWREIIELPGSDIEVYRRMANAQSTDEILEKVLNNLVLSVVKQEDAPMSASTHFNTALYDLLRLVPGYKAPAGEEGRDVIVEAVTEIKMLRGNHD